MPRFFLVLALLLPAQGAELSKSLSAADASAAAAKARKAKVPAADAERSAAVTKEVGSALGRQDFPLAFSLASQAVSLNPANAQAWNLRAVADVKSGLLAQAVYDASYALALSLESAPALQSRSRAYAMQGSFREALQDADQALRRNPDDALSQENRAFALAGLGDREGALQALGRAAAIDARFGPRRSRALALPEGDSLLPAFDEARPAGSGPSDSSRAEAFLNDAQNAMGTGEERLAIENADRALAADPGNVRAFNLRAIAHQHLRDYAGELDDVSAGLKLDPANLALLNSKATALNRLRRHREALAAADAAVAVDPNNYYAHYMRGEALAGLGEREAMVQALRKAADLNPGIYKKLQEALQLPSSTDTSFLFPEDKIARGAAPAPWSRNLALLMGLFLLVGGLSGFGGFHMSRRSIRRSLTAPPASPLPAASPGLLRGQFKTLRQIGAGGMGLVYEGTDVSLDRRVAIKKMREEIRRDPRERERFIAEAKLVAALHHPYIVDIYAIVEEGPDVYLVFEYVAGRTIHELITEKGRYPLPEALRVVREVASALDYAHGRHVIHRDLKPSNIMINDHGHAKVMDFGVARQAKDALGKMTNTIVGTPPYMAPEQEQGHVRPESDVYSLAVCLYEMLCGCMPFDGIGAVMHLNKAAKRFVPATHIAPRLPPGIDDVFGKAFEPDPDHRFRTASELARGLGELA